MKSNEEQTTPYCAIASFSVGNITTVVNSESRVISGSEISFMIDHKDGIIQNVDSLPNWVSLEKVVPTYQAYGSVYVELPEGTYYLSSGSDSLNLTVPRTLKVVSTDEQYSKTYTLRLNKKSASAGTLVWNRKDVSLQLSEVDKAVQMGDSVVLAFGKDAGGQACVVSASVKDCLEWTAPQSLAGGINLETVVAHSDSLFALFDDGYLYGSKDGRVWNLANSGRKLEKFLVSDSISLYSFDGDSIVRLVNGAWEGQQTSDVQALPDADIYSASYVSNTNGNLRIAVMGGTAANTGNCVCWYKVSHDIEQVNEPWSYIQVTSENPYVLPRLNKLSVVRLGDNLLAFGLDGEKKTFNNTENSESVKTAVGLFRSRDNGITWPQDGGTTWGLPTDLYAENGAARMVVVKNSIFLLQGGNDSKGALWIGSMR